MSEINNVGFGDKCEASVISNTGTNAAFSMAGKYEVKCYDKDGNLKWDDVIDNRVVDTGLAMALNGVLANTAGGPVYMGLFGGTSLFSISAATILSDVTTAGGTGVSTNGELTSVYTVSGSNVRATLSFTAATSTTISATAAVFLMAPAGATLTVYGCFLVTGSGASSTKQSTGGKLFSIGAFTNSKIVSTGDSLSVSYSVSSSSA